MTTADLESWRFDLALAEIEAALMDDAELQKQFGKHLNYIPGSSYTLVYFREMERRGLVELLCAGGVEPCAEKAGV